MTEWNDPRPLKNWAGEALAVELMNMPRPGSRHILLTGALETLATLGAPLRHEEAEHVDFLLMGYLNGLAAAAIVADVAGRTRHWTSARDFALGGREVEFLPPDGVLLGTLTLALTAVGKAISMADAWGDMPRVKVPEGHRETMEAVQRALAQATQTRMTQVSNRAEDVNGV